MSRLGKLFTYGTIKKVTAIGLGIVMSVSLAGCGKSHVSNSFGSGKTSSGSTSAIAEDTEVQDTEEVEETIPADCTSFFPFGECFYNGRFDSGELVTPEETTTAEEIYANMTYTAQMFYGDYRLNHPDDGIQTTYASQLFLNSCSWWSSENVSSLLDSQMISAIPYRMVSGTAELDTPLIQDTSYNWCQLYFATQQGTTGVSLWAAYVVDGNTITFTPLESWDYNEDTMELSYAFQGITFSYTFSFCGPRLTFSNETESYTLIERDFTSWLSYVTEDSVSVDSTLSQNSPSVDDITGIEMTVSMDTAGNLNLKKSTFTLSCTDEKGGTDNISGIARWDEDGLFTFSYENNKGEVFTHQMVLFYCGFDGLVLSDGKKNYYYLSTWLSTVSASHYEYNGELGSNISEEDEAALEEMTEEEVEEIIETRTNLLTDLTTAFSENGIAATVDDETGDIVMDSSILFATGQYELSDAGKEALTNFITAFASVISDDKYDGFISRVEVQGHTDTSGNYEDNLVLSQERADTVRDYCLNDVDSLSEEMVEKLSGLLDPVGYSSDYPVYDENGNIDMDASRRVEFLFYINLTGK